MCYRLAREDQGKEENIKENLVIKCKSHSKDVARLAVQAFLPELWLLDDSSSPAPSPAHFPHAITEQTRAAFLLFLSTTPFSYSSFLEGRGRCAHLCVVERNEADRIRLNRSISWVTDGNKLEQIPLCISGSDAPLS